MELIKTIFITTFILFCMGAFIKWRYFEKYCRTWKPTDYDLLKEGDKVRMIDVANTYHQSGEGIKHDSSRWEVIAVTDKSIYLIDTKKKTFSVRTINRNSAKQYLIEVWR